MIAPSIADHDGAFRLGATSPPESRGLARDEVRLLVSRGAGLSHYRFRDLADLLEPEDLLVVNRSATWAASLPARHAGCDFRLNLSTWYGGDVWVAEARRDPSTPGVIDLPPGTRFELAGISAERISTFPGIPRLSFYRVEGDIADAMAQLGEPIRYGYLKEPVPLAEYQTIFSRVPGSAEMPSAARPFTERVLSRLRDRGIGWTDVLLHTGVSSLEYGDAAGGAPPIYPEPFEVDIAAVEAIRAARRRGGRIIAVGTTVVRALESATDAGGLRPARGFTRTFLSASRKLRTVDGLITGFHERRTTHLDLVASVLGEANLQGAYRAAIEERYLWHEFGDSHLAFPA